MFPFCAFVTEFGLSLTNIFHKRKNGENFEKILKFYLNTISVKCSFWCVLMFKFFLLEISPFFLLLVSELKRNLLFMQPK